MANPPVPNPPVFKTDQGKIIVNVSGPFNVKIADPRVQIVRQNA